MRFLTLSVLMIATICKSVAASEPKEAKPKKIVRRGDVFKVLEESKIMIPNVNAMVASYFGHVIEDENTSTSLSALAKIDNPAFLATVQNMTVAELSYELSDSLLQIWQRVKPLHPDRRDYVAAYHANAPFIELSMSSGNQWWDSEVRASGVDYLTGRELVYRANDILRSKMYFIPRGIFHGISHYMG